MTQKLPATQFKFNSGEISPRLYGRPDIDKYASGLETATNVICLPHGPVIKRNGSKYMHTVKTSADPTRIIRFQKSVNDNYILEFGDLYIRVLNVDSLEVEIVTTYAKEDLFELEYAQFGDDLYIAHNNYPPARLHRYSDSGWILEELSFTPPATVEDGEFPDTTLTPAATTGSAISFTAGADSFRTNDVGRQLIYRDATTDELLGKAIIVAYTSTTVVDADITMDFPSTSAIPSGDWKIDLSPNTTVTPGATGTNLGDTVTLTTVANTWKDTAQVTYVGRYVHIQNGIVRIDTVTSDLIAEGEVVKPMDAVTATDTWTLQEASWTTARGYPKSVGFFEERLWLGGNSKQTQTLWGSASGDFTNFGAGADDSDALDLLISDSIASPISWISSGRDFIVGGAGGEFTISSSGGFITPSDRSIRLRSTHGSSVQQVDRIDNETIFIDSSTTSIRSIRYDFDSDSYIADDLLFFSDHLAKDSRNSGIVEIAVAQRPNNLIYAVLSTGDMLVGQFNRQQQVLGWERFQTKGDYKSVATITVGDHDEVWVVVERLINGTEVKYIERFDEFDDNDGLKPTDGFLDSFINVGTPIPVTSMTSANPPVVTLPVSHGLVDDDVIVFYDALYNDSDGTLQDMGDVNTKTFTVANAGATSVELSGIDGTAWELYNSGGSVYKKITSITGLSHLEGEVVSVKQDNGAASDRTVASGSITLTNGSGVTQVGLSYTSTIKTLKLPDSGTVSIAGQNVRFINPILRLYRSVLPTINDQIEPIRDSSMLMDVAPNLYTGDAKYSPIGWEDNAQLEISDNSPFPIMINAVFGIVEIGEL